MKAFIPLILTVLFGCSKETTSTLPSCIQSKIELIEKEAVWNPAAKIYRYSYQGKTVYFFPQRCCDIFSELYDENCTLLCHPDGGITGQGDGQCPDFFKIRSGEVLVWEDERRE
ncbi:hypothetical protein N9C47_04285 [Flavobacteriaceae bacterium]|jgi:YHS domain-containing protein|nr:hypothetical protein [Flavobacteriaceae bacterium]MDA9844051.1 hypothetical protein [Flavobacteriaceae bacterium]